MIQSQNIANFQIDLSISPDPIIEALRSELQEYAELLNLLKLHQVSIINRDSPKILDLNDKIENQITTSANARQSREVLIAKLASSLALRADSSIRMIIRDFPDHIQSLISTLFSEILNTVQQTQDIARQNQFLIQQAMEFTEKLLAGLHKKSTTKTYNRKGKIANTIRSQINCLNASA